MKRRDLIRGGAAAGAAALLPGAMTAAAPAGAQRHGSGTMRRARSIIFFAYDGLTWEDVAAAQGYARRHRDRPLAFDRLYTSGRGGSMQTHSLTSIVTDSSAASSAWSTGRKIVNGMVNVYPDGSPLTTIMDLARAAGKRTGLISTARITHATPACWVAKVAIRDMEDDIAAAYLDTRTDVLLGGGARHFDPARRTDRRDLAAEFRAAGYDVLRSADELDATHASRLLGIFTADHVAFEIDRRFQQAPSPSLAAMTRKGLAVLDGAADGFVVQIEAGRIDHSNHKNDYAATLWDVLAADEALAIALDYVDRNPDTLLIAASDHATGGGAVYGAGSRYRAASDTFDGIAAFRASIDHMLARIGTAPDTSDIVDVVEDATGVRLTARQAGIVLDVLRRGRTASPHPAAFADQPHNTLGFVLYGGGDDTRSEGRVNVNFATGQHTAGIVPVAVYGPPAADMSIGIIDNTHVFGWLLDALGTRFENPVMTEAEARRLLQRPAPGADADSHPAELFAWPAATARPAPAGAR